MRNSEYQHVSDVTTYVQRNPSLRVGIDNSTSPGQLGQRRAEAIRDALINSGTPAEKIQITAFNEPLAKQDDQVGVLFISAQ
jgi:outer membrane protein OmpA-like peptidoglycan-associated protein